ncbi:MAG: ACP S-malonyltransferase [Acidobacteriota bacterium]
MKITVLLDHDIEGQVVYLEAGLADTGWDQLLEIEFIRLRDCGLAENTPDSEVWRYVQEHGLLLITNNRNNRGETSLHATIARENTPDSLPVVTISETDSLRLPDYRLRAAIALVKIIIYPEDFRGTGRTFIP